MPRSTKCGFRFCINYLEFINCKIKKEDAKPRIL